MDLVTRTNDCQPASGTLGEDIIFPGGGTVALLQVQTTNPEPRDGPGKRNEVQRYGYQRSDAPPVTCGH